jgi:hypothetical protein
VAVESYLVEHSRGRTQRTYRISVLLVLLAIAPCVVQLATYDGTTAAQDRHEQHQRNVERTLRAYSLMQSSFLNRDDGLYWESFPISSGNPNAYLWPASQALAATVVVAALPTGSHARFDLGSILRGLQGYWNSEAYPPAYDSYLRPPLGHGGDRYYDDNVWIGLELVTLYQRTHRVAYLSEARQIFEFMVSGWDDHPDHPHPGGVFWTEAGWNDERGTVSTANAALLAFHLYEVTHEQWFLDWGRTMYAWVNRSLLAPDNGLYWDHIELDGSYDIWQGSYNQGAMIGASIGLARITGDIGYFAWAKRIADRSLAAYGAFDTHGALHPYANAIYFAHLLELGRTTCTSQYQDVAQVYADRLWLAASASPDGLLRYERDAAAHLLDQAALVRLHGELATPAPACSERLQWPFKSWS